MNKSALQIVKLKGSAAKSHLFHIAELRIKVFREYPYLYDGDLDSESKHLESYANNSEALFLLIKAHGRVVGCSTASPLALHMPEAKQPFIEHKLDVTKYYYYGESVLLPEYRGNGIYQALFEHRENAARIYGASYATFCGIQKPDDDPDRPSDYVPLDNIWQKYGYVKHPELTTEYTWRRVDSKQPLKHKMVFWLKHL